MDKKLLLLSLPLLLSGCDFIYNSANNLGKHMPTIGEPCYNWQCVTDEGQKRSDLNKRMEEAAKNPPAQKAPAPANTTAPSPLPPQ